MPAMEMDEPVGFVLYSKDITGRQVVFKPQEDYQCFSRDDWARMAHLINDYHWLWDYSIGMNIIASKYQEQIGDLKLQVSNWEKMADRMNESRLMVGDLLKKEEKYKRIELKSAKINKALMWTSVVLAAIEAGVIGALSAMQASE